MAYTQEDLKMAERHVAEGAQHIARQKRIITEVARDPRLLNTAQRLLSEFEATQRDHIKFRDTILAEMSGRWRVDCLRGKFNQ